MEKKEIKNKIKIEELIGESVELKKSSNDMMTGRCPFHKDDTPSLRVYVETNSFTCFGCNASGDIFSWVMRKEGVDFKSALKMLEDRVNKKPKERSVLDSAVEYYRNKLSDGVSNYLTGERGLTKETIERYKIGYAPGEGLYDHLKREGYTKEEMLKYSLINESEFDYFRNCIIFPNLEKGRVRYLSGRGYPEKRGIKPKGLPTPLFMPDALSKDPVIIAEGEIDTLTLLQNGYNAVGVLGAKCFKSEWSGYFKDKEVFISLDGDEEGRTQSKRIAELIGPRARIVSFPDGEDVNSFFKSRGKKAYDRLLEEAKPLENTKTGENRGERPKISSLNDVGGALLPSGDISFEEVKAVVKKWLYFKNYDIVDVVLGTAIINRRPIDPVWVFLVDPPSSGKTEILRAFQDPRYVYTLSKLTPKTLVSGKTNKKNYNTPGDPSLCSKLNNRLFIVKDFTTVLQLPHFEQNEIFSVLRDMYDGYIENKTGETAEKFRYDTHTGFLGAVTLEIDRSHLINGILGERFLKYRLDSDRDNAILKRRENRGKDTIMRQEINNAFDRFLNKQFDLEVIKWEKDQEELVEAIADLITNIRTPVARDWRNFDVIEVVPQAEMPMRFCNSLQNLADGIALVRGEKAITGEILNIIIKIAFDCLPQKLCRLFKILASVSDPLPHSEIGDLANLNTDTVTRIMDDWNALGVVMIDKTGKPYKSVLNDNIRAKIGPFKDKMFGSGY